MKNADLQKLFASSESKVKRIMKSSTKKHVIVTQKVQAGHKRETISEVERKVMIDHFESLCHVPSGAVTDIWKLPLKRHEAYEAYRAEYPKLLMKMAEQNLDETMKSEHLYRDLTYVQVVR